MSTKLDWEKANRNTITPEQVAAINLSRLGRTVDKAAKQRELKAKMDEALAKEGWQKCPNCGGGRHPYFPLCSQCSFNYSIDKKRKKQTKKKKQWQRFKKWKKKPQRH